MKITLPFRLLLSFVSIPGFGAAVTTTTAKTGNSSVLRRRRLNTDQIITTTTSLCSISSFNAIDPDTQLAVSLTDEDVLDLNTFSNGKLNIMAVMDDSCSSLPACVEIKLGSHSFSSSTFPYTLYPYQIIADDDSHNIEFDVGTPATGRQTLEACKYSQPDCMGGLIECDGIDIDVQAYSSSTMDGGADDNGEDTGIDDGDDAGDDTSETGDDTGDDIEDDTEDDTEYDTEDDTGDANGDDSGDDIGSDVGIGVPDEKCEVPSVTGFVAIDPQKDYAVSVGTIIDLNEFTNGELNIIAEINENCQSQPQCVVMQLGEQSYTTTSIPYTLYPYEDDGSNNIIFDHASPSTGSQELQVCLYGTVGCQESSLIDCESITVQVVGIGETAPSDDIGTTTSDTASDDADDIALNQPNCTVDFIAIDPVNSHNTFIIDDVIYLGNFTQGKLNILVEIDECDTPYGCVMVELDGHTHTSSESPYSLYSYMNEGNTIIYDREVPPTGSDKILKACFYNEIDCSGDVLVCEEITVDIREVGWTPPPPPPAVEDVDPDANGGDSSSSDDSSTNGTDVDSGSNGDDTSDGDSTTSDADGNSSSDGDDTSGGESTTSGTDVDSSSDGDDTSDGHSSTSGADVDSSKDGDDASGGDITAGGDNTGSGDGTNNAITANTCSVNGFLFTDPGTGGIPVQYNPEDLSQPDEVVNVCYSSGTINIRAMTDECVQNIALLLSSEDGTADSNYHGDSNGILVVESLSIDIEYTITAIPDNRLAGALEGKFQLINCDE